MENIEDVKKVTQSMVDNCEITEDIQELFLKMIKDSCDISITLDEVKSEIEEMIIGEHKNPHLFDTLYLKFKETKSPEYTNILHNLENKF